MKNWKSISAILLAGVLVTSTAGQVLANDEEKEVDTSKFETVNLEDALESVKDETATGKDLEAISSIVPMGYLANNIFALSNNLEKISNPKAKEALRKNIERAIARWEAKINAEVETSEEDVTTTPDSDEETTVTEKHEDQLKKEEKKVLKKAERLARAEAKKAAKLAKAEAKRLRKEEHNADKNDKKDHKDNKKEEHRNYKKEERNDRHSEKHERNGKEDRD